MRTWRIAPPAASNKRSWSTSSEAPPLSPTTTSLPRASARSLPARSRSERGRVPVWQTTDGAKWAVFAFAATLLLTTIGAAAVMLREHRRATVEQATNAAIAATLPRPPLVPEDLSGAEPRPRRRGERPAREDDRQAERRGARSARPEGAPRAAGKAERRQSGRWSAAELFARANLLRRRDEVKEAAGVYASFSDRSPARRKSFFSGRFGPPLTGSAGRSDGGTRTIRKLSGRRFARLPARGSPGRSRRCARAPGSRDRRADGVDAPPRCFSAVDLRRSGTRAHHGAGSAVNLPPRA